MHQHKPLKLKQELQLKPALQLRPKQELLAPHVDETAARDWTAEESKAALKGGSDSEGRGLSQGFYT